jgi:hypothetical protein
MSLNLMVFLDEEEFRALLLMAGHGILDLASDLPRERIDPENDEGQIEMFAKCGAVYWKLLRELKDKETAAAPVIEAGGIEHKP